MRTSHTATAQTIHWLMALLLIGLLACGLWMTGLPLSPGKLQIYAWHKWAGVTAFVLAGLRIVWRLTHRPPAYSPRLPRWQARASHAMHSVLYGLMLTIPISGWLMSSAKGFTTVWFGVLPLPDLLVPNRQLGAALTLAHRVLNYTFIALVIGHTLAALTHSVRGDHRVLQRMLPQRAPRNP